MKRNSFQFTAGAVTLAAAAWVASVPIQVQPMYDRIQVNLPYTVTMQNKTLQPGDYTIQQLPGTSGSGRVLLFYTKDGMKFETSANTIPALDVNTARDTKVVLNHIGDDFYISKIWVQGKDYGYELPVPDSLKSRQNERVTESSVPATYQPSSSTDMTTTSNTTAAETAPPADATTSSATAAPTETTPSTEPATTEPATQPAAQPAPEPAPQPATSDNNSADRVMPDQDTASANSTADRDKMPSTSAGWLTMLWAGSALSGAGLMLQRKR